MSKQKIVGGLVAVLVLLVGVVWFFAPEKNAPTAASKARSNTTAVGTSQANSSELSESPAGEVPGGNDRRQRGEVLEELTTADGDPSSTLEVVVSDSYNQRVNGADVVVYFRGKRDVLTYATTFKLAGKRQTNSSGSAEIKVPPGSFVVAVSNGGPKVWRDVTIPSGSNRERVDIRMPAGHLVTFVCVEAANQRPVPLCEVTLQPSNTKVPKLEFIRGEADPNGRLIFGPIAPGRYEVRAEAAGFAKLSSWAYVPGKGTEEKLAFHSTSTLAGKVVDAEGREVAGATVQLIGEYAPQTTTTGSAGGFTFDTSAGEYAVSARKDGSAGALDRSVYLKAGESRQNLVIKLGSAATIRGTVLASSDKHPLVGVEVAVSPYGEAGESGRAVTKPDGTFEVTGLSPGGYDVEATLPGFTPAAKNGVTVEAGQSFAIVIELDSTGTIVGRVADEAGKPLSNVKVSTVWPTRMSIRTDGEGKYELRGVETRSANPIEATPDGATFGVAKMVKAKPGESVVLDFVIPASGTVSGTVTHKDGSPATNVSVIALNPGVGFRGGKDEESNVDAQGNFELTLPKGDYALLVIGRGGKMPPVRERFSLAAGEHKRLNITLAEAEDESLVGAVVEADGRPASYAALTVEGLDAPIKLTTYADKDGLFELSLKEPSRCELTASRQGRSAKATFDLREKNQNIVLTLAAPTTLSGEVKRTDGKAVESFSVQIVQRTSTFGEPTQRLFSGQRFSLKDVPVGTIEVVAESDGLIGNATATTRPDGDTHVIITLQAPCSVKGRFTGLDGSQLEQAFALLDPEDVVDLLRNGKGEVTGEFHVGQTRCGERTISISAKKYKLKKTFTLQAGQTLDLGEIK